MPEVSMTRKALTALTLAVVLLAAVVVQLTVVNRLPLPGAAAPDLVLLLVTAIAVATSPLTGAVTGFAGGLALDIAPPAAHYAGEYALVFCLAGYAAARVNRAIFNLSGGARDSVTALTVMVAATAAGEAGKAALGMLLSDPDVTGAVVSRVLPGAILYDLLLAPLVFWLVARVTRATGFRSTGAEHAPAPEFSHEQRLAPVFRHASAGAVPNLRLAGTGENYRSHSPSAARRVPKLRLSGASAGSSLSATAAFSGGASSAVRRTHKLSFGGDLPVRSGTRLPQARTPGKNWLRASASSGGPAARRPARGPAPGWLRPSHGALAGRRATGAVSGLPRGFMGTARSAGSPIGARSARSAADALAARSAPSGLSALSGAGTPLAGRAPRAGWLRASRSGGPAFSARRLSPRTGWLGSSRRPRTVIGSGVRAGGRPLRPRVRGIGGTAGGNWYTASPSGAWLRRSRHPWRKRRQRLLRMVGVGK